MDKEKLLKESKVFCMGPWVHLHTSPTGNAGPCCIAKGSTGSSLYQDLGDLINTPEMKQLRVDMLNGVKNPICDTCHRHEEMNVPSARSQFDYRFNKHIDEVLDNTHEDGHLDNFKMRYFDIRFNNICNFKCRTCNADYSSQWEQEDLKRKVPHARIYPKNNRPNFLEDIIEHVPHMEYAYFAGGEPLITEEHYTLLEEMIRQRRTDIRLVYNSNVSNLKFKSKDVVELWSHFSTPIEFCASIDHIGERAEYIRHGTDWGVVESNLMKLKKTHNVLLSVNSVVSAFNYVTLHDVYRNLINKGIYMPPPGPTFSAYSMTSPEHFNAQVLPIELKKKGRMNIKLLTDYMRHKKFIAHQTNTVSSCINWAESADTWDLYKDTFQHEIRALDLVRGEDFVKVFPELATMMD
jgi:organic radical activating enzyme/transcription elongation factor Elf1